LAERCSLQFQFQRIDRLEPEFTSQNLVYGSSIHAAASWMYRLRKEGQRVQAAEIRDIFADSLSKMAGEAERVQYDEGSNLDSLIGEGRTLVDVLVESQRDDETILEVDLPFEVPLTNSRGETSAKPLVGELDLVVAKGREGLTVRDLKTSKKRYPEEKLKHDLQPTTYLFAMKQLHPHEEVPKFEYEVLLKNKKPELVVYPTTRNQGDFDRLFKLAATADRLIESGAFLPNRGSYFCKSCPFQRACDEWHRTGAR
jgi:CRISPR/Cas system-associated exonuclease Cas4 (RecB family)